jgi:hypothetical protein
MFEVSIHFVADVVTESNDVPLRGLDCGGHLCVQHRNRLCYHCFTEAFATGAGLDSLQVLEGLSDRI